MINYSAYSKLYITFSYASLDLYDYSDAATLSLKFIALNSSGGTISSTAYQTVTTDPKASKSAKWSQGATEKTASVDISSYNGMGGFKLNLYLYDHYTSSGGTNTTYNLNHTAYIQKIYLA